MADLDRRVAIRALRSGQLGPADVLEAVGAGFVLELLKLVRDRQLGECSCGARVFLRRRGEETWWTCSMCGPTARRPGCGHAWRIPVGDLCDDASCISARGNPGGYLSGYPDLEDSVGELRAQMRRILGGTTSSWADMVQQDPEAEG